MKKYKVLVKECDSTADVEQLLEKLALEGWAIVDVKLTALIPWPKIRIEALLERVS